MPLPAHAFQDEIVQAVKKVTPSVVSVSTIALVRDYYRVLPIGGMGSGVVIDKHGHIVTNRHVIEQAQRLSLADSRGNRSNATLLGSDGVFDVAVLHVEDNSLPPASLGDSDDLQVGQIAIAIGNPYGFMLGGPTVTTGVISAVNRSIQSEDVVLENLIQTDAAINPGNSGGPLVDIEGRVIGINTATIPFAQGIGFATAINTVRDVATEIIDHGFVRRAYMGFAGVPLSPQLARNYRLPVEEGVLIAGVVPRSPAARAGLEEGDVIIAFDGERIRTMTEIQSQLRKRSVGSRLDLTVVRGRTNYKVTLVLGEVPT
jgi:S1-C subfamily serine protease